MAAQDTASNTTQDTEIKKQGDPALTLHVYENLIQIPVLVLGPDLRRENRPIDSSRFSISIDAGPWFHPSHVRPQGDDPLSLAILLDVNGNGAHLMAGIADAVAGLAPRSLRPQDHVSIYGLDCMLVRATGDMLANATGLRTGVEAALSSWKTRKAANEPCKRTMPLQEALVYVTAGVQALPGRHVILAVTDGDDRSSRVAWHDVAEIAQANGTAVFGVMTQASTMGSPMAKGSAKASMPLLFYICEASGGMVMGVGADNMAEVLTALTTAVRERYIIDFPRPSNSTAGRHSLDVRVEKSKDVVRPAGVSIPIADPAIAADPTTVPSDPAIAPVQGKRRELPK